MCFVNIVNMKSKKSSVSRSMFSFQKRKGHFAFHERLVSYPFFHDIIELASVRREERIFFLQL